MYKHDKGLIKFEDKKNVNATKFSIPITKFDHKLIIGK